MFSRLLQDLINYILFQEVHDLVHHMSTTNPESTIFFIVFTNLPNQTASFTSMNLLKAGQSEEKQRSNLTGKPSDALKYLGSLADLPRIGSFALFIVKSHPLSRYYVITLSPMIGVFQSESGFFFL